MSPSYHVELQSSKRQAMDRSHYTAFDICKELWSHLNLPPESLSSLNLPGDTSPALPSSFKIGILAQSTIALSALTAALIHTTRTSLSPTQTPAVTVSVSDAVVEFKSERFCRILGQPAPELWGPIGGLHEARDGHVRIHDGFENHKRGALELLGLRQDATRENVAEKVKLWGKVELEEEATVKGKLAIYALRSYEEWDALPQASAICNSPILLKRISTSPPRPIPQNTSRKCLQGIRVVEMSRVIAAPLAGRTLSAHGADVIWVTSPNLPDLPAVDRDFGRGKKTFHLDVHDAEDKEKLLELIRTCDVFLQSYRPGSLAAYGLGMEDLVKINPGIVYANLSAFGPDGPWAGRRGFDSLVQTCSGMNVSEAEHSSTPSPAKPLPCQALDHGAGYLLATGISAALYHRCRTGGAWQVDVSLAGVMKLLRSLGQYEGESGFECEDIGMDDVPRDRFEERDTGFGRMVALRHCVRIGGCDVGWERMPRPLGSDAAEWT